MWVADKNHGIININNGLMENRNPISDVEYMGVYTYTPHILHSLL